MTRSQQLAVLAAASANAVGRPIELTDLEFWQRFGEPPISIRRDILARAAAIQDVSERFGSGLETGLLSDLFDTSAFPASGGMGGPAATPQARVFVRVRLETATGGEAWKSLGFRLPWNTTMDDALSALDSGAEELEGEYGLSDAEIKWETLIIY